MSERYKDGERETDIYLRKSKDSGIVFGLYDFKEKTYFSHCISDKFLKRDFPFQSGYFRGIRCGGKGFVADVKGRKFLMTSTKIVELTRSKALGPLWYSKEKNLFVVWNDNPILVSPPSFDWSAFENFENAFLKNVSVKSNVCVLPVGETKYALCDSGSGNLRPFGDDPADWARYVVRLPHAFGMSDGTIGTVCAAKTEDGALNYFLEIRNPETMEKESEIDLFASYPEETEKDEIFGEWVSETGNGGVFHFGGILFSFQDGGLLKYAKGRKSGFSPAPVRRKGIERYGSIRRNGCIVPEFYEERFVEIPEFDFLGVMVADKKGNVRFNGDSMDKVFHGSGSSSMYSRISVEGMRAIYGNTPNGKRIAYRNPITGAVSSLDVSGYERKEYPIQSYGNKNVKFLFFKDNTFYKPRFDKNGKMFLAKLGTLDFGEGNFPLKSILYVGNKYMKGRVYDPKLDKNRLFHLIFETNTASLFPEKGHEPNYKLEIYDIASVMSYSEAALDFKNGRVHVGNAVIAGKEAKEILSDVVDPDKKVYFIRDDETSSVVAVIHTGLRLESSLSDFYLFHRTKENECVLRKRGRFGSFSKAKPDAAAFAEHYLKKAWVRDPEEKSLRRAMVVKTKTEGQKNHFLYKNGEIDEFESGMTDEAYIRYFFPEYFFKDETGKILPFRLNDVDMADFHKGDLYYKMDGKRVPLCSVKVKGTNRPKADEILDLVLELFLTGEMDEGLVRFGRAMGGPRTENPRP